MNTCAAPFCDRSPSCATTMSYSDAPAGARNVAGNRHRDLPGEVLNASCGRNIAASPHGNSRGGVLTRGGGAHFSSSPLSPVARPSRRTSPLVLAPSQPLSLASAAL